jgi:uncharacterized membrane protein
MRSRLEGARAALAREPLLAAMVLAAAAVYATYSIVRHTNLGTGGFDLGIFDQAVWHYSRLEEPASSIKGFSNVLGDHFSPIVALLAPLYWIWPDPRMLLLAQALLVASATVPIFLFTRGRLGRAPAYLLTASYGLFWGVHEAIGFDFHEVAFASPIVAWLVLAVDRRRWTGYWIAVALLLLVKEDLSFLVVFVGIYLATLREYRRAALTAAVGVGWYFLATEVLIPAFSDGVSFQYWTYTQFGDELPEAALNAITEPWRVAEVVVDDEQKVRTLGYLFLPFLALALCSRLVLLAIPLVAARLLSTVENFWETNYHYSLVLAPILLMAAADALPRVLRLIRERRRHAAAVSVSAAIAAINLGLATQFDLADLTRSSFWTKDASERDAEAVLERVPPGESVAAQNNLAPHLARRPCIRAMRLFRLNEPTESPRITGDPELIVGDLASPEMSDTLAPRRGRYRVVFREGSWAILARAPGRGARSPCEEFGS